ncbi:RNA-directed DNA polymerase from mobile element jockey-like [Brachionus plicatilis]|uniref:RNA-directed DNA polymerase from mobile element jockey-like n=1 Tax=Brachionus plicatilis TaxID=10195 RepID=A0A3M7PI82_BRAPC|nr:RNA-directed DNA polymerase from mobile element jockey-like [Brachionus plicatilis]
MFLLKLYIFAIDASKAFDKVNRTYLWHKIIDKLPDHLTRAIMVYYDKSLAMVTNNGEYSRMFKTTIGVKQGGPLSPRLFAIYLEDLVNSIDQLNLGVKVGKMLINIVLYADDILLMAESSDDLQTLANTTMEFGEKWQIKYNPSKTVLMAFGMPKKDKNKAIKVEFEKQQIKRVNTVKYLGVQINDQLSNSSHLDNRRMSTFATLGAIKKNILNLK